MAARVWTFDICNGPKSRWRPCAQRETLSERSVHHRNPCLQLEASTGLRQLTGPPKLRRARARSQMSPLVGGKIEGATRPLQRLCSQIPAELLLCATLCRHLVSFSARLRQYGHRLLSLLWYGAQMVDLGVIRRWMMMATARGPVGTSSTSSWEYDPVSPGVWLRGCGLDQSHRPSPLSLTTVAPIFPFPSTALLLPSLLRVCSVWGS